MTNKEVQDLIQAFGAMAEALAVFKRELIRNGFSQREAAELTKTYLISLVEGGRTSNG